MPARTFEYSPSEKGWIPVDFPNADAASENGMVHDILEHFPANPNLSPLEDELLALGAFLHIRTEDYYAHYRPDFYPVDSWKRAANSISGFILEILESSNSLKAYPQPICRNASLSAKIKDSVEQGLTSFIDEYLYLKEPLTPCPTALIEAKFGSIESLKSALEYWMLRGFRQAKQRYRYPDGSAVSSEKLSFFYGRAEQELAAQLGSGEFEAHGRIRVSLSPASGKVRITRATEKSWY